MVKYVYFVKSKKVHIAQGSSTLCGLSLNIHKFAYMYANAAQKHPICQKCINIASSKPGRTKTKGF